MKDIEKLLRPNIASLCPYSTARDDFKGDLGIFVDANVNPYDNGWNRYPDPHQAKVKEALSAIKGVPVENLFLGNGSDEAIDLVFRVFCRPGVDNAVAIEPSYGMYSVSAATNDVALRSASLIPETFALDEEKIASLCDPCTKVLFLCSPNNPSGNAFDREQILRIADNFPGVVVVDEAYVDFSSKGSLLQDAVRRSDMIVLQTLSKAWGMASLRLGMAVSCQRTISLMSRVKYPYNISLPVQKLVLESLDKAKHDSQVKEILQQRRRLEKSLRGLGIVRKVYDSDANFLLVKFDDADSVYEALVQKGVIVRNRDRVPLCKGCLRITVGTPEENDRLVQILSEL